MTARFVAQVAHVGPQFKVKILSFALTLLSIAMVMPAYAGLQELDSASLAEIQGQGGADLSLVMRLNQKLSDDTAATTGTFNNGSTLANDSTKTTLQTLDCPDIRFCRLAVAFNNRADASGNTQWLVFKGVQGYINIPKIGIDGVDVAVGATTKTVLQLSFDETKPIQIRHLGFQSLSIETDSVARKGYLEMDSGGSGSGAYSLGKYTAVGFDQGREVGFAGLDIHGNLSVQGKFQIFSCPGSATTRC